MGARKVALLLFALLVVLILAPTHSLQSSRTIRYVNKSAPTCGGHRPCYAAPQSAVNAALPGETVLIQAGVYDAPLSIDGKNNTPTATEANRILITADPAAPVGSVVLKGAGQSGALGEGVVLNTSKFITVRGLTITKMEGRAIVLDEGKGATDEVHLERNRIFGNGLHQCRSGILVRGGNTNTLIVNNLIYGNGRHGLRWVPRVTCSPVLNELMGRRAARGTLRR